MAPFLMEPFTYASFAYMDSMSTFVRGERLTTCFTTSTPPSPGMATSRSSTFGLTRSVTLTASSPSPASPTTWKDSRSSSARSASRNILWSSATTTVMASVMVFTSDVEGNGRGDRGPASEYGLQLELPAKRLQTLLHADDSGASDRGAVGIESHPPVPDPDPDALG